MRLFKIILVIFGIYFIRRFFQLYRAMEKRGREMHAAEAAAIKPETAKSEAKIVDAEYKVLDR